MDDQNLERFILVIDRNPDHATIVRQVLSQKQYQLQVIDNVETALDCLYQRHNYTDLPRPDLILLDLSLPNSASLDILHTIKTNPQLRHIPVIVLTESDRPEDVFQSYLSQANCYVVKATDLDVLAQTIKRIEDFWLEIVTLPFK
ncbi:MAG: response regulator [Leptolyngbyaceae cyanobacterium SM2_5_2]|nr:response regulator [Leptolyngbyaceae cyanobacterium SM2_5_2]